MSDLLNQASLVYIPSGYKEDTAYSVIPTDGSGDLTFTRASDGTRVNSQGLVERVPWNLVQQSNTFETSPWSNTLDTGATLTYTANYGTAPDGTNTAGRLQMALNGSNYSQKNQIISVITGQQYTYSVWIKSLSGTKDIIFCYNNSNNITASVTTEWQRFTHTFTGNSLMYARFVLEAGTSTSVDLLIYGAQLNEGSTAKPYFPTTDRQNVPRLDYSNGCPSLLLEPQRTNLMYPSEDFSSGNYIKAECSITTNQAISPDGTQNADSYISTTNNVPHPLIYLSTQSGTITYSLFVKKSYSRYVSLKNTGGPSLWGAAIYDLDSIAVTKTDAQSHTIVGTSIVDIGNGWRRITLTTTGNCTDFSIQYAPNGTATFSSYGDIVATGTNQVDYYIWGAQLEAGTYPTSYIPTTSASVTRVADAAYKTGISSLIGQTEGVIFADCYPYQFFTGQYIGISDGGTTNRQIFGFESDSGDSGTLRVYGFWNTSFGTYNRNQRLKIALAYKANDFVIYVNGTQIGSTTAVSPSGTLTYYAFNSGSGSQWWQGGINQAVLFKTRLTNAELAALTTL